MDKTSMVDKQEIREWIQLGLSTQIANDPRKIKLTEKQLSRMRVVLTSLDHIYSQKTGKTLSSEIVVQPPAWLVDDVITQTGLPEQVVVASVDLIPYHIQELLGKAE